MSGARSTWTAAGPVVARVPALAVDVLDGVGDARAALRVLVRRADVREAIALASPPSSRAIDAWAAHDHPDAARAERTALRYVSRMATRPTPFGLFAGWALGAAGGARTAIELDATSHWRRHSRLDLELLGRLVAVLEADPTLRRELRLWPNPTLYEAAGRLRYIQREGRTAHHLVLLDPDPVLTAILARAETGASFDALADVAAPVAGRTEAEAFVAELLDAQVLVTSLAPAATGRDPLDGLLDALSGTSADATAVRIQTLAASIASLDDAPPGVSVAVHDELATAALGLPAQPEPGRLVRTDLLVSGRVSVGEAVVDELGAGVELLSRIGGVPVVDRLRTFRSAFQDRFGDREVPLLVALDDECGVGFPDVDGEAPRAARTPAFLDGGPTPPTRVRRDVVLTPRDEVLTRLVWETERAGAPEMRLGPAQIEELARAQGGATPLPETLSVMATVLAATPGDVARGNFRVLLSGASGPAGTAVLGRFCTEGSELTAHVRALHAEEQGRHPEAVLAEVVHLPHPRSGNVVSRPVLREHEIPLLARSGAPPSRQLAVGDLVVSVVGDRVLLRSRRLDVEVLPRLSAAHDPHGRHNLPVYRFLCALRDQGVAPAIRFHAGTVEHHPYLPRITAGRLVLRRASWTLSASEARTVSSAPPGERYARLTDLRVARGLPRWVAVAHRDQLLTLDLDNPLAADAVATELRRRSRTTLVELFLQPGDLLATGSQGRHTHELVVPLRRRVEPPRATAPRDRPAAGLVPRTFPPGSEWLYLKLYTGTVGDEAVLRDVVRPVVARALTAGAADGWFFVRYGDPRWHVRVRLHGDAHRLLTEVWPDVQEAVAPLLANGLVWRVQLDTYEREMARYGGPAGIAAAEAVFRADSDAVLALLASDVAPRDRWLLAVTGTDRLLADADLDVAARRQLVRATVGRWGGDPGAGAATRELGRALRLERGAVERALDHERADPALVGRSARVRPLLAELATAVGQVRRTSVLRSLAHMHANRLLGADAPRLEPLVWDVLDRGYSARLAREAGE